MKQNPCMPQAPSECSVSFLLRIAHAGHPYRVPCIMVPVIPHAPLYATVGETFDYFITVCSSIIFIAQYLL